MNIFSRLVTASLMVFCASPQAALAADGPIELAEAQLYSVLAQDNGKPFFTKTNRIPYIVDKSCYEWLVKFQPQEGTTVLTEELQLPAPAKNWGLDARDKSIVSPEKDRSVTSRKVNLASGVASAGWCIVADDPTGSYSITLKQDGRVLHIFRFTVGLSY